MSDSTIPWTAARQASLSFTISQSLLKLMSIELVMPSNHLTLCCPLLLLPSIFPSKRVFSSESALRIRWPKYWSFSISPSCEYSGLISFQIDWFDFLAVQGLTRVFSSTIQKHQFFSIQPSLWSNSVVKNLPAHVGGTGDTGSIPGLGRTPGVGNGNPQQYSCLENSMDMDRRAWRAQSWVSQ